MKKYLLYANIILLAVIIFTSTQSCACKKKKSKKAKITNTNQSVNNQDTVRVVRAPGVKNQKELDSIKNSRVKELTAQIVINFVSLGGGIDANARNIFMNAIKSFEAKNNCKLKYQSKSRGREGEIEYCFIENDSKLIHTFFVEIKEKMNNNRRVFVEENSICR